MREKGSKTAMQELVKRTSFIDEINGLLQKNEVSICAIEDSIPNAKNPNKEVTLSTFLRNNFGTQIAADITKWWIKNGNATPKWDLISKCTIKGEPGILLVEAKAHYGELKKDKKILKQDATPDTLQNHDHIADIINSMNGQLKNEIKEISISIDTCYQFSNRVAHAWWLANQGIPVVLLYLGFLNVKDMEPKYTTFKKHDEWKNCFENHIKIVGAIELKDKTIDCGKSSFVTICKSI